MGNFGVWEAIVLFVLIGTPCGLAIAFSPPVIQAALTEIRKMWRAADPGDNHTGR